MPLKVSDGIGAWIKDFKKSDAPQFKGKSEKKRRDQAIAAYLSAKRGPQNEAWETIGKTSDGNYKIQRDTETGDKRRVPNIKEETPTGKQVKQAIGIARDKRYAKGNMTGAVKAMDKINPKLSGHPKVKGELQKQNESKQVNEILPALATVARVAAPKIARSSVAKAASAANDTKKEGKAADRDALQKAMDVFKKRGGKITKVAPGKAAGYHGKDDPGAGVHGMMDKGDTKAVGTRKKVKSMGEAKQTHVFDNEKDARAKAKEIGGKYVKGTGKSDGKHAAIKNEEFTFKVEVEGLPQMFMSGNSPGEVKSNLRKLIKQPSMLKSIDRVTKATLRKKRRAQMQMGEGIDETAKKKFIQDPKVKNLKIPNPRVKRPTTDMYKGLNMSNENRRERLRAKLAAVGKDMDKTNKELKKTMGIKDKPEPRTSDGKPYKSKYFTPRDEGVMDTLKSVGSAVAGQFTGRQAKLTGNASKVKSASDMRKRGATPK